MDDVEQKLYQEENRQALIDLNKSVNYLIILIKEQNDKYVAPKDKVEVTGAVDVNTEPEVDVNNLDEITESLDKLSKDITNAIKDNSYKPEKEVSIKNIKDAQPKDIKINNLTELAKYFTTLGELIKENKPIVYTTKQDVVFPTSPTNPIAVRLSNGKSFYNALVGAFSGASQDSRMNFNELGELKTVTNIVTSDVNTSGSLSGLNSTVNLEVGGTGSAIILVSGTWNGKILFEGSIDDTWVNLSIVQPNGGITFNGIQNDNQNGSYRILIIAGYSKIRARMSQYSSGSATIEINASSVVGTNYVWQLVASNLQTTANQTSAANLNANVTSAGANLATETTVNNIDTYLDDTVETRVQTPTKTKAMNVQIGPGDVISNIPVFMDFDHHQIHEGETFRWSFYSASFLKNTNKDIRLVVPNITIPAGATTVGLCPHFRFEVIYGDQGVVDIYETPTFTGNGTQKTPIQLERNGTYTSKLQVWEDPTVSVVGTLIWQGLLLGNKNSVGGIDNSQNEFVLKNNTSYLIRFTSGATDSIRLLIRLVWYEDLGV